MASATAYNLSVWEPSSGGYESVWLTRLEISLGSTFALAQAKFL